MSDARRTGADRHSNDRRTWAWFLTWMLVGAGYAFAFLSMLSIGFLILPFCVAATVVLARRRGATGGLPGVISGLGIPLAYVAYLNRGGPGTVCRAIGASGQECTQENSPWVWLAVSVFVVLIGVALFAVRHGSSRRDPS